MSSWVGPPALEAGSAVDCASGTGRSDAQPSVSAEDMAMFRLFNPDCTEAQVQAYMKKKTGG